MTLNNGNNLIPCYILYVLKGIIVKIITHSLKLHHQTNILNDLMGHKNNIKKSEYHILFNYSRVKFGHTQFFNRLKLYHFTVNFPS